MKKNDRYNDRYDVTTFDSDTNQRVYAYRNLPAVKRWFWLDEQVDYDLSSYEAIKRRLVDDSDTD